jgi:hypothetical protein
MLALRFPATQGAAKYSACFKGYRCALEGSYRKLDPLRNRRLARKPQDIHQTKTEMDAILVPEQRDSSRHCVIVSRNRLRGQTGRFHVQAVENTRVRPIVWPRVLEISDKITGAGWRATECWIADMAKRGTR